MKILNKKRAFTLIELTFVLSISSIITYYTIIGINQLYFYNQIKKETTNFTKFLKEGYYNNPSKKVFKKDFSIKNIKIINHFKEELFNIKNNKIILLKSFSTSKGCYFDIENKNYKTFILNFKCNLKKIKFHKKSGPLIFNQIKKDFPEKILNYNIKELNNGSFNITMKKINWR